MSEEIKENEVEKGPEKDLKPEKKEALVPAPVFTTEKGLLVGKTLEEQYRIAKAYMESGMIPKAYKSATQVLVGMQYAYELGLNPLMALRQIAVINGQPSLWGDLPLGLVRRSKELVYIREWFVDKTYKEISFENKNLDAQIFAALCEIERKGFERRVYHFTQADKHNLGINAIWEQFESIMMKRKARSLALKDQFSDILEGMNIAEYDHHTYIGDEGMEVTVLDKDGEKLANFKNKLNKDKVEVVE